ncbi:MAG: hypothetical protein JNG89_11410 [Planctomycetaceae bacterium]|nr:hypothetical protein [Planctomycetaceae bacterium]
MKSEHRHELAENDLSKLIDHGRDRIEPYTNKVLLGLLVATVLIVGAILLIRSRGSVSTEGSAELAAASTAAEYDAVASRFDGTPVGQWARLRAGEQYLRDGIQLSLSNRPASNENLDSAEKALQQVLESKDAEPEVREKALYALAVCLEAKSSEVTTTKPAIEAYEQLLSEFGDSRYAQLARDRVAALKSDRAAEFYTWFHQQNPRPEDRPPPRDFPSNPFGGPSLPSDLDLPADMPAESDPATGSDALTPGSDPVPTEQPEASDTDPAAPVLDAAPATDPAAPVTDPGASTDAAAPASEQPATPETSDPAPVTDTPANP